MDLEGDLHHGARAVPQDGEGACNVTRSHPPRPPHWRVFEEEQVPHRLTVWTTLWAPLRMTSETPRLLCLDMRRNVHRSPVSCTVGAVFCRQKKWRLAAR